MQRLEEYLLLVGQKGENFCVYFQKTIIKVDVLRKNNELR